MSPSDAVITQSHSVYNNRKLSVIKQGVALMGITALARRALLAVRPPTCPAGGRQPTPPAAGPQPAGSVTDVDRLQTTDASEQNNTTSPLGGPVTNKQSNNSSV